MSDDEPIIIYGSPARLPVFPVFPDTQMPLVVAVAPRQLTARRVIEEAEDELHRLRLMLGRTEIGRVGRTVEETPRTRVLTVEPAPSATTEFCKPCKKGTPTPVNSKRPVKGAFGKSKRYRKP